MQYILAHDLGTSGDKATLFTVEGELFDRRVCSYPCFYSDNTRAEQNPEDWYAAVCKSTRALCEHIDPADIVGISFSGQMMGAVFLDDEGLPMRPSIIWADQRATLEQKQLAERLGDDRFYAITGNRNNPTNSIAKIMWALANGIPKESLYTVLNCKDYIVYRLTGNLGTDYSDASGTGAFDLNAFAWSEEILQAAGIPIRVMPNLQASTELAGKISQRAAAETGLLPGTPVFRGCGDGTAASVGAGIGLGEGYICLGTSAWISYMDEQPLLDPLQRVFNLAGIEKNSIYPIGTMQASGSSFDWMVEQLCQPERDAATSKREVYDLVYAQIESSPVGSNGVIFLPYLMGERSPWWDSSIKGAFLGLGQETRRNDMLRAVVEGVSFNLALILDIFRQHRDFSSLRIIGGGAQNSIWRQILSNILNVRIQKPNLLEEGCSLGAAIVAGIGAGVFKDASAIHSFLKIESDNIPATAVAQQYSPLLGKFAEAYHRLQGFYC